MANCKTGECSITGTSICCQDCGRLRVCVEQWESACRGESDESPMLCTFFDANRGDCKMLEVRK